jgi:hypothetical protein
MNVGLPTKIRGLIELAVRLDPAYIRLSTKAGHVLKGAGTRNQRNPARSIFVGKPT